MAGMDPTRHADAARLQETVNRLRELESRGQATPEAIQVLRQLEAKQGAITQSLDNTTASYRGAIRGVTGGLRDEAAGVLSAMQGQGYTQGREQSIARDIAAQNAAPENFDRARTIGGGFAALGSLAVTGPALPLGMAGKTAAGFVGGGGIGALQGQSSYEMAGRPAGERMDYYAGPAVVGAVTGGAAYPAGRLAGAAVRGIRNMRNVPNIGYGARPLNTLTDAYRQTENIGVDVQAYLDDLTPEAMLADVEGPLQGTAQGLAAMRGEGGSLLANAINKRAKTAGQRITADMDANIGTPNAAFAERQRLAQERSGVWGPQYEAALAAPGAIDVRPMLRQLQDMARVAGTDTAPILRRYISDLEAKAPNGLIEPAQLHWIRSDLSDARTPDGAPTKRNALVQGALQQVDRVLDANVPGYAEARTGYGNTFAMEEAIQEGQEALRGGRATASSPEEFAARFNQLSDAQKDAFRTGLRRDIAGLMGTSKNDAAAAWGAFSETWNPEKLRIALGDDAAEPIIKRLRSEKVFSETRGKVTAGTRTAETQERRDALGDYRDPTTGQRPGPVARAKQNLIDNPINAIADAMMYGDRHSQRNIQLGQMLSATGDERRRIARALLENRNWQDRPSRAADSIELALRGLLAGSGGVLATGQN